MQIRLVTLQVLLSVDLKRCTGDDKDPFVRGLDFLPDGRLVAVDNYNCKCFVMNNRLQRKGSSYKFKTPVFDVCCLFNYLIAVSTQKHFFMSVTSDYTIHNLKTINTSSPIFSISCLTSSKMLVSTYNDNRLARMISFDGLENDFDNLEFPKKTYRLDESKSTYVQSKNTLVLTDKLANTVYMYDTVKGTYSAVTDEHIQQPTGVCVGPADMVLVCSVLKKTIVHLTVDGDIVGTYPVDMVLPYVLCVIKD